MKNPLLTALAVAVLASQAQFVMGAPVSTQNKHAPRNADTVINNSIEHAHEHTRVNARTSPRLPQTSTAHQMSLAQSGPTTIAAVCDLAAFESASGSSLTSLVKSSTVACLNDLYSVSGSRARNIFMESKMSSIAYALRDNSVNYPGNNSTNTLQLVTFMRAGYYVQFYNAADVGTYGPTLKTAIQSGLDSFFGNGNSMAVNDANGEVLSEMITLVDSSTENARYLSKMKDILNRFDNNWLASWYMRNAGNNVFTVMFRGHQNADFKALVQSDNSIVDTLYNFYNRWTSLLPTENDFLPANAAREMARFLQYTGSLKSLASARSRTAITQSSIQGDTAPIWVGIADMVDYYDKANCSYYGVCDYKTRINNEILVVTHTCNSALRIRGQEITSSQLSSMCADLATSTSRFHTMLETNYTPVAGDLNAVLELVVWNSSKDYGTYAGALYGIDTNNGGMYLEGSPTVAGNQARFIAYEAEWLRPTFKVWNLEHEGNHYLDGRFDMQGDFGTYLTANTIWWIEGMAEYVAFVNNNPTAVDALKNAAHVPLSTVFRNTYSSGTDRVYRWGYMAVRFMFERHMSDVRTMLGYFRNGNYSAYDSYLLNTIGSRYDTEFQTWLTAILNGGGTSNQPPVSQFSFTTSGLTANFTDGSTDSDGSIASRSWSFGDGTSSTATNPSKTYSTSGSYTVSLTVVDNQGASNTSSKTVTVSGGTTPPAGELQNGVAKTGLAATTGNSVSFTMNVPSGASNLKFVMSGGTGDADMYVRFGSAPTTSTYDCRPYLTGNNETCTISTAQAGTYHVMLRAYSSFTGVNLTGSYTGGSSSNTPPVANFSHTVSGLTVNFTDSSTDADGTIASRSWNFGDNTSSTATNPSKTFSAAGTYNVSLTVTDNKGATNTTTRAISVSSGGTVLPECSASDTRELGKNCKRSNRSGTAGNYNYMYVYLPAGTTQLKISTSGGTGNADLYVSTSSWATQSNYQYYSANAGNGESVMIYSPSAGYVYISLYGVTAFSGVTVSTEY